MKKIMFPLMIFFSAVSFAQDTLNTKLPVSNRQHKKQDDFISKNITGKWKDQNSTIFFYPDATYCTLFDEGGKDSGYWEIKKSKIILMSRPYYIEQTYQLLYFSKTIMQYRETENEKKQDFPYTPGHTIWIATKIANFHKNKIIPL